MGLKLQVMSDLHIAQWGSSMGVNYWNYSFPQETQTDADVLILAGDCVSFAPRDLRWTHARLQEFGARYKHVIFVPGNHEFYGTGIDDGLAEAITMETQLFGFNLLRTGRVLEIDGQRFIGGTMWQPHRGRFAQLSQPISDHYCINDFKQEAPRQFKEFKAFMEAELKEGDIVVTHHAPSFGSMDAQYAGDPCNRWFITPEIEPLLVARKPLLWVHGHTHTPFDYKLGETRVLCNPKGYPNEGVRFNPQLIVAV